MIYLIKSKISLQLMLKIVRVTILSGKSYINYYYKKINENKNYFLFIYIIS